ncbi:hypothetical protein [Pseudomonas sp. EA_65y_Pfl2_P78]|jgi:hypothetical protein|uniref:hypothetical protein n=1 Tax=Pseudomonas sp. EA_65y_Pfl2_P78 TaxID=3088695 RepID=UPI0030D91458
MQSQTNSINTPNHVMTPFTNSQIVSQHPITHQSAAMLAALMVSSQYSRAAKSQFSRKCLDHLKASLASVQDVSA